MQKSLWLSFDLGVKGDYESMYAWLDNHQATACGDNMAFMKYEVPERSADEMLRQVTKDLRASIDFKNSDRIYIAYLADDGSLKGRFVIGKRRAAPWQGYGDAATQEDA